MKKYLKYIFPLISIFPNGKIKPEILLHIARIRIFVFYICSIQNKHYMKSFFSILLMVCIYNSLYTQSNNDNNCVRDLYIDPIIETQEKLHYIFTGSDTTGHDVRVTKITVVEGRRELVKRRKKGDCDSPNPDDCFTQVLEEIPPVTMNLYTLKSPEKATEYDTRTEKVYVTTKEGGVVNEKIVCTKNRSPRLIKKVQEALITQGYPLTANGIYDQATSLSVTDFQKTNKMAYGDLTLGVLAALNVQ